jgi:hypothetical protein
MAWCSVTAQGQLYLYLYPDSSVSKVAAPSSISDSSKIFLFLTRSILTLDPIQLPVPSVHEVLSVQELQREADHSPPSSGEVKNGW